MFTVKHNEDDFVVAYAEYFVVNEDGSHNKNGEYAFISDCWVHPKYNYLKELIKISHQKHPQLKYIYYQRRKYKGRKKMFRIERMYEV